MPRNRRLSKTPMTATFTKNTSNCFKTGETNRRTTTTAPYHQNEPELSQDVAKTGKKEVYR
jgi:hypothetical protein